MGGVNQRVRRVVLSIALKGPWPDRVSYEHAGRKGEATSHVLRNPVFGISSWVNMHQYDFGSENTRKGKEVSLSAVIKDNMRPILKTRAGQLCLRLTGEPWRMLTVTFPRTKKLIPLRHLICHGNLLCAA